jgi:hypothetical protein
MASFIDTVNVIVFEKNVITEIASFKDNEKGNKKAEKVFQEIVTQSSNISIPTEDMEDYTENGNFETKKGKKITIFHSSYQR